MAESTLQPPAPQGKAHRLERGVLNVPNGIALAGGRDGPGTGGSAERTGGRAGGRGSAPAVLPARLHRLLVRRQHGGAVLAPAAAVQHPAIAEEAARHPEITDGKGAN